MKRLRNFFADHIDPDGIQLMQGLRTAVAGVVSILFYHYSNWSQSYWLLLSSTLILQTYLGKNTAQKLRSVVLTGLAAAAGATLASLLSNHMIALASFLFCTTLICLYQYTINSNVGNAAYFVNLFCISAGGLATTIEGSKERFLCILLGTGIAVITCLIVWPEHRAKTIRKIIADNFQRLSEFNRVLNDKSMQEKQLTIRRNRVLRGFQRSRDFVTSNNIDAWKILSETEHLYEILLSLDQLKKYLYEQQILKILNKELLALSRRVTWVLKIIAKNIVVQNRLPDLRKFIATLQTFERVYLRHLSRFNHEQILAFSVYIDNIYKLEKTMIDIVDMLSQEYCQI